MVQVKQLSVGICVWGKWDKGLLELRTESIEMAVDSDCSLWRMQCDRDLWAH